MFRQSICHFGVTPLTMSPGAALTRALLVTPLLLLLVLYYYNYYYYYNYRYCYYFG